MCEPGGCQISQYSAVSGKIGPETISRGFLPVLIMTAMLQYCVTACADEASPKSVRHGNFEVTLTPSELLDSGAVEKMSPVIGAHEEVTWKMYVPETYDADKPAGLMVYISPSRKGSLPRKWRSVINEKNLIWISANQSGNSVATSRRLLFAALGPQIASERYEIDDERIYLSGFSGGGKVASIVAIDFAHLFKGAIYICGALHWERDPPKQIEHIRGNRYVFLSGDNDFNLESTLNVYQDYKDAGLSNVSMIRIPGMGHSNPDAKGLRRAISFLDDRR